MAKHLKQAPVERWEEGHLKWWNTGKGYGFVTKADGRDVMLHATVCNKAGVVQIRPGTRARVLVRTTGGLDRATDIEIMKP